MGVWWGRSVSAGCVAIAPGAGGGLGKRRLYLNSHKISRRYMVHVADSIESMLNYTRTLHAPSRTD